MTAGGLARGATGPGWASVLEVASWKSPARKAPASRSTMPPMPAQPRLICRMRSIGATPAPSRSDLQEAPQRDSRAHGADEEADRHEDQRDQGEAECAHAVARALDAAEDGRKGCFLRDEQQDHGDDRAREAADQDRKSVV